MAKSKGLDKAVSREDEVEVVEKDFIPDTQPIVLEAEEKVDAEQIRKRTLELKELLGDQSMELAKHLSVIRKKQLFLEFGFKNFNEYILKELQFKKSKAMYLIALWNKIGHDDEIRKQVMSVGWTKAKEIIRVIDVGNQEDINKWVDLAKTVSADALVQEVKAVKRKKFSDDPKEASEDEVQGTLIEEEYKTFSLSMNHDEYVTTMTAVEAVRQHDAGATISQSVVHLSREYLGSAEGVEGQTREQALIALVVRHAALLNCDVTLVNKEDGKVAFTNFKEEYVSETESEASF